MSYDEHLISMAGGDGDSIADLAAIEAHKTSLRRAHRMSCSDPSDPARKTTYSESADAIDALLALVRDQQDQLDRVLELAHWAGKRGWQIPPAALRNTISGASA